MSSETRRSHGFLFFQRLHQTEPPLIVERVHPHVHQSTCRFWFKRNHYRGQSSHPAIFGHTGCWSIATWNANSPRSSRNRLITMVKLNKKSLKNSFEKWKKPERPPRSVSKIDEYIIDYASDTTSGCFFEILISPLTWTIRAGSAFKLCTCISKKSCCGRSSEFMWARYKAWGDVKQEARAYEAPQASHDKQRHRNCFQTRPLASNSKRLNISWGQTSADAIKPG